MKHRRLSEEEIAALVTRMEKHGWGVTVSAKPGREHYPFDVRHPQGIMFHWGPRSLIGMADHLDRHGMPGKGEAQGG